MKNNNKGFSLVELIVVIAIMAILAAVAVVGFSMYIPKAQQAADKNLVNDVAYALELYYYNNPNDVSGAYVVLTPDGNAVATEGFANDAMFATFGANWETELKLQYAEWTDDGLLALVSRYTDEELDNIAQSTFIKESSPEGLMSAVTNMTGIVSDVIAGTDLSKANDRLNSLLGDGNSVVSTLNNLEVSYTDKDYSTIVSNLLVKNMADGMQSEAAADSDIMALLTMYSTVYAYSEKTGDDTLLNDFNTALDSLTYQTLLDEGSCTYCESFLESNEKWEEYSAFAEENAETDMAALQTMMGAVSQISGTYNDKESLSNENLYSSSTVSQQVNNYVNSVKSLANMSETEREALSTLPAGSIAILVAEDGIISVIPEAAWSRS